MAGREEDDSTSDLLEHSVGEAERPRLRLSVWPGQPAPEAYFAAILHVTDIHLDRVDPGPAGHRRTLVRVLQILDMVSEHARSLAVALLRAKRDTADEDAWRELVALLEHLVGEKPEDVPIVVAQTGDVEAFGADARGQYLGYAELHQEVWPRLEDAGATCVDVYGNHDIWPYLFLGWDFRTAHHDGPRNLASQHRRLLGPWDEIVISTRPQAPDISVHRICTVEPSVLLGAFAAQGRIGPEPVARGAARLADIGSRLSKRLANDQTVHIALSHHPLHRPPRARPIALVRDVDAIVDQIATRVLVLSGHLHRIHPPVGETTTGIPQLIANTPTVTKQRGGSASFVQYLFVLRAAQVGTTLAFEGRVRVERLVYKYWKSQGYAEPPIRELDVL